MSLTCPRHIEYKKLMELWLAYWHGMFDMSRKNCRILIQFDMGLSLYLLPINNWPTHCTTTALPPDDRRIPSTRTQCLHYFSICISVYQLKLIIIGITTQSKISNTLAGCSDTLSVNHKCHLKTKLTGTSGRKLLKFFWNFWFFENFNFVNFEGSFNDWKRHFQFISDDF